MKTFLIIIHILLGLTLIFYAYNDIPYLYRMTHDISSTYPDYATNTGIQDFVQNIRDTMPERILSIILKAILGIFAIVGALAFRKDKRWATLTLPLVPSGLFLWIVYVLFSSTKTELAWTGGILTMVALVLLLFLISEILYLIFRKQTQIY